MRTLRADGTAIWQRLAFGNGSVMANVLRKMTLNKDPGSPRARGHTPSLSISKQETSRPSARLLANPGVCLPWRKASIYGVAQGFL